MRYQLVALSRVGSEGLVRQPLLPPGVSAPSVEVARHTFFFESFGETAGRTLSSEVRVTGEHAPAIMPALAGGIAPSDRARVGAQTFSGPSETLVAPDGNAVVLFRYPSGFLVIELTHGRTFWLDERPLGFVEGGRALLVRGDELARVDVRSGARTSLRQWLTYRDERVELGLADAHADALAVIARRGGSLELVDARGLVMHRVSDAAQRHGDLVVFAREPLGVQVFAPQRERVLSLRAVPDDAPPAEPPPHGSGATPPTRGAPAAGEPSARAPAERAPARPSPPEDPVEDDAPKPPRPLAGIGCATTWIVAVLVSVLRWSAGLGLPHAGYLVLFAGLGSAVAGLLLFATDNPDLGTWENMDPSDPVERRSWNATAFALAVLFGALGALLDLAVEP